MKGRDPTADEPDSEGDAESECKRGGFHAELADKSEADAIEIHPGKQQFRSEAPDNSAQEGDKNGFAHEDRDQRFVLVAQGL